MIKWVVGNWQTVLIGLAIMALTHTGVFLYGMQKGQALERGAIAQKQVEQTQETIGS